MAESSEPAESSQRFFSFFQHEVTALQQQMDRLGDTALAGGERIDATSHCQAGISRLSSEVKSASVYLPAYDQRTYTVALKALQDRLEQTRATFAPKPKFAFKNIRKNLSATSLSDVADGAQKHPSIPSYGSEPPSTEASSAADTPEQPRTPANEAETADSGTGPNTTNDTNFNPSSCSATTISHERDNHIIFQPVTGRPVRTCTLSHLSRCFIDMSAPTLVAGGQPFAGVTLRDVTDSLIVCGRVSGAAHMTNLTRCTIVVSCRQFRMHESADCDVYLRVTSTPIVEDVRGIRFAPLPDAYADGVPDGTGGADVGGDRWEEVQDFKWLKEEQSPNWSILPSEKRVEESVWRDVTQNGAPKGHRAVLKAVGVM